MKKYLVGLLIIILGMPVLADEVSLSGVETKKIELPKTDISKKQSLLVNDEQVLQELVKLQKDKDVEDIENLWKGTVENNQDPVHLVQKERGEDCGDDLAVFSRFRADGRGG